MNVSWSIYVHLKLAILGNVQTICYSHIVRVYFENLYFPISIKYISVVVRIGARIRDVF